MIIDVGAAVFAAHDIKHQTGIELTGGNGYINLTDCYALPPLINAHDHLVGDWWPRAGNGKTYINTHIWVEDMLKSAPVLERNNVWVNNYQMSHPRAKLLTMLGAYKNLFSGVGLVQDHLPVQAPEYYEQFPIEVLENYRQCHSLTLGNWWGGHTPQQEYALTKGTMPFIVHLGEGLDHDTRQEFNKLKELDLLKPNTVLIHGISLTKAELKECRDAGTSICWCPASNIFLIGQSFNAEYAVDLGVNVMLCTDSSLSGSINLLAELDFAYKQFPGISPETLYNMVTTNAAKGLMVNPDIATLKPQTDSVLIMRGDCQRPLHSLLCTDSRHIELFVLKGQPLYGFLGHLNNFDVGMSDYNTFEVNGRKMFAFGHPLNIEHQLEQILGYPKYLPYLPWQKAPDAD